MLVAMVSAMPVMVTVMMVMVVMSVVVGGGNGNSDVVVCRVTWRGCGSRQSSTWPQPMLKRAPSSRRHRPLLLTSR